MPHGDATLPHMTKPPRKIVHVRLEFDDTTIRRMDKVVAAQITTRPKWIAALVKRELAKRSA